ncbi:DUF2957 domain-containing protein [Paraburkholderia phenazinium]|jgi:hypothetical protein|uniref:DUF2957 family protein n=1 Tax=Paraburkholderia phenazinium TaxID=60549 RepID=A0A1N6L8F7_9BURK|nr:DUF2957 domain-containing protein [Paraburkholderia phenazinium]SIO64946.1 Protein of unknown function [Paraburkholderia phenazinium]
MWDAINRGLALALITAPLLIACGGGSASNPSAVNAPQCSGSSCTGQGAPTSGTVASLCPATADIGNTTYLGGAGSGEVVSLNINATAMTYTLSWLESPIPLATGTVSPTRAGVQITGPVAHPPTGALPTAEQIRCAFVLEPGTGSGPNGTYSTSANFNAANPPTIFVGLGVAGGGIPGATVQFSGVLTGIGAVDNRHFDFYPFLAFANTTTDITKLPGTYNGLLYHLTPSGNSGNYATVGTSTIETFDSTGACTSTQSTSGFSPNAGGCLTTGNPYTLDSNGYFDSAAAPQIITQTLPTGKSGVAHMILGQLNGATIPLVVRTGNVNIGALQVDDESGIAMLAPATALASGGFDGGYVGADSNFDYTATLINGASGTFVNPGTSSAEDGFSLTYGVAASPGLVGVTAQTTSGTTASGFAIAGGGLYAILIQGEENNGVASTSAISGTAESPYFGIGAQVNK